MKNCKHLLLLTVICAFLAVGGMAQDVGDEKYKNIPKRLHDQKDRYDDSEYLFPPQPKSNWSIGIKGGIAYVSGDVKAQPGIGLGFDVRKALGHVFSLRLHTAVGQTKGINFQPSRGYQNHIGNPWNTLYDEGTSSPRVYYNYQMRYGDISIQGMVNLNNINFYKEQSKWNIYVAAGIGLMAYNTKVDALNASNEIYDFSSIPGYDPTIGTDLNNRRDILDALNNLMDGEFETPGEVNGDVRGFTLGDDTYQVNPAITAAAGFRYRLSRRVEIEIEHRMGWTNDDLLDGQRWQESRSGGPNGVSALTGDFDSYNQTTIGLHFRIGPGEESLWWSNPLTDVYSGVQEAKDIVRKLTDDADSDGIPDLYDQEPDTPEGMVVDAQGITMDSDGDGYPDTRDDQPYTPKGCDVDENGVALDSDADGVPDCYDKEPDSAPGVLVDAKGITIPIMGPGDGGGTQPTGDDVCILPIIYFDLDRDNVKPDYYPELYYIAQVLKSDPNLRILAIGHTDVRSSDAYNQGLSERRVNNAINFLSETYGIDRSRFDIDYRGEEAPQIPNLPDNRNSRLEPLHAANRRVEFECIR